MNLLENEWERVRSAFLPDVTDEQQLRDLRRVFYFGCMSISEIMLDTGKRKDGVEKVAMSIVEQLQGFAIEDCNWRPTREEIDANTD